MKSYKLFIGGKWVDSSSKKKFATINPATEKPLAYFQQATEGDVQRAIDAAEKGFEKWRKIPAPKRGEILLRFAGLLRKHKDELSRLVSTEMGKVLPEAAGDVQEAIDIAEYMAGEGRRLFGHTTPSELSEKFAMTMRMPIGVCSLITPWNFPMAIPAWKLMPALICGNGVVFKPSSDTPLCAVRFVELLTQAGVPAGVVNFVTGSGEEIGLEMISNKKVRGVSFTGSHATGEWIVKHAGIKKIGLEMGGKNAIIVMDDADLDLALKGVLWGAFGTTGQRCTATSRVILHQEIYKKFEKMLVDRTKLLRLGPGISASTDVGPLINRAALDKTHKYTEIGLSEGAKLLCGGKPKHGKGFFYHPTVFSDVDYKSRIAQEEIFGPVVCLIPASNLEEAIKISNSIEYGLSSSIYTRDISNAFKAIEDIEAGITYVNASTIGAEVHLPFGGIKGTGNGAREAGILGIEEFSEIKAVYIDYSGKLQRAQID